MIRKDQKKWIDHLRDDDSIKIMPFDPTADLKFKAVRSRIRSVLGNEVTIEHRGATRMGISGQDEIDIYIPVGPEKFDALLKPLKKLFGQSRSLYPLERARFVTEEGGKHVDVFLINERHKGWNDCLKFEDYLNNHPEVLRKYELLKEKGNGLSSRKYYHAKIKFINDILGKIDIL